MKLVEARLRQSKACLRFRLTQFEMSRVDSKRKEKLISNDLTLSYRSVTKCKIKEEIILDLYSLFYNNKRSFVIILHALQEFEAHF